MTEAEVREGGGGRQRERVWGRERERELKMLHCWL